MDLNEFQRYIDHETQWLKYYGYRPDRKSDMYDDHLFYDRIQSIGYAKVVTPLSNRCVAAFITSDKPVLTSSIEELYVIHRLRNHKENIYSPLEYLMANKILNYIECINILKEIE